MADISTGMIMGSFYITSKYSFLNKSKAKSLDSVTSWTTLSLPRASGALLAGCSILIPKLNNSIWIAGSYMRYYCDLSKFSWLISNLSKIIYELASYDLSSSATDLYRASRYALWFSLKWISLSSYDFCFKPFDFNFAKSPVYLKILM